MNKEAKETKEKYLGLDVRIGVGFGIANYSRDGKVLWEETAGYEYLDLPSVADVEQMAAKDPGHDWRIYFDAPLWEAEYQRQPDGRWKLIREGRGFA